LATHYLTFVFVLGSESSTVVTTNRKLLGSSDTGIYADEPEASMPDIEDNIIDEFE